MMHPLAALTGRFTAAGFFVSRPVASRRRRLAAGMLAVMATFTTKEIFAGETEADIDPRKWINRMHVAVENLNYQGTLVRMRGDEVENFRVYHRVTDGDISERLVGMDGDGFEVIRQGNETLCIFPAQQSVVVEKQSSNLKSPIAAGIPAYDEVMEESYTFSIDGDDRVAGRQCKTMIIKAVDEYRYGYRIWLDGRTGMPLKSQLRTADDSELLEEVMFADILLIDEVPASAIVSAHDTADWKKVMPDDSQRNKPTDMPGWKASELPPGFELKNVRYEYMMGEEEPRLHLVYMDSLASVSVFIDRPQEGQAEGPDMMGATNAYTVMNDGWSVTAVGQVPQVTVELIARSMTQE